MLKKLLCTRFLNCPLKQLKTVTRMYLIKKSQWLNVKAYKDKRSLFS